MFLQSPRLLAAGFPFHGFTTREGGVSEGPYASWNFSPSTGDAPEKIEQNFARLAEEVELPRGSIYGVHQVHSDRVVALLAPESDTRLEKADALFTSLPQVVVGVKTADCVPVLMADPTTRSVAAIHAGWRGVVSGIVTKALAHFSGSPLCVIGPHISYDQFQVGPEVIEHFPLHHKPDPTAEGKFLVDLRGALVAQLQEAGVSGEDIEHVYGCTITDERFYSHRRSGGVTGRMFNFIGTHKRPL